MVQEVTKEFDDMLEKMFGVGLPDVPRSEWPEGTDKALKSVGPGARVVRKRDGSISIFSTPEFSGDVPDEIKGLFSK